MATRKPNVGTYPNDFGGLDTQMITGTKVRTSFNDGEHAILVFENSSTLTYEVRMGFLTPEPVWRNALVAALRDAFGVRGEQLDRLVHDIGLVRDNVVAKWGR